MTDDILAYRLRGKNLYFVEKERLYDDQRCARNDVSWKLVSREPSHCDGVTESSIVQIRRNEAKLLTLEFS